jgi:Uma2 family endonuclease
MSIIGGLTIEDFERLPDALAHNHELVDGELIDVSGNTGGHNLLRGTIVALLFHYLRDRKLGLVIAEQDFDFDGNAHGPDVSFIVAPKVELVNRRRRVQPFVPDLAIEIVSQNDNFDALIAKALRYRRCGTSEVFIFSIPNRQVFRYSAEGAVVLTEDQDFRPEQIPGFSIRIRELFDMI